MMERNESDPASSYQGHAAPASESPSSTPAEINPASSIADTGSGAVPPAWTSSQEPAEPQWHALHPMTPWLRNWAGLVALGGMAINMAQNMTKEVLTAGETIGIWPILTAIIGALALLSTFNYVSWRMARFRVTDQVVELKTGVIAKQHRSLRLDQLEAVDIVRPLIPRLFGLTELRCEAAGGDNSSLTISFLSEQRAAEIHQQVLSKRHQALTPEEHHRLRDTGLAAFNQTRSMIDAPTPATDVPEIVAAPGDDCTDQPIAGLVTTADQTLAQAQIPLFRVPPRWTIMSYLRTPGPWVTLFISAAATVGAVLLFQRGQWGSIFAYAPILLVFVRRTWKYLVLEMGFTIHRSGDDLKVVHGLTTQVNQTIQNRRIQAIRLSQRRFWRQPNWWRVDSNIAGYGLDNTGKSAMTVLAPVADLAAIRALLAAVWPVGLSPDNWRGIEQAMADPQAGDIFATTPRRARRFHPLSWRRLGFAVTPDAVIIRQGHFSHRVLILPHNRIQALGISSGPWDRDHSLRDLFVYSVAGPVIAQLTCVDAAVAEDFVTTENQRIAVAELTPQGF
ncbi:MAG: PH domain-containing protein [Propionibacteriaceae bacterium]|jgi:putative membrane protein|nr:PH domain-containing protein [Propionibacteriaceae bacterium]